MLHAQGSDGHVPFHFERIVLVFHAFRLKSGFYSLEFAARLRHQAEINHRTASYSTT